MSDMLQLATTTYNTVRFESYMLRVVTTEIVLRENNGSTGYNCLQLATTGYESLQHETIPVVLTHKPHVGNFDIIAHISKNTC